MTHLTTIVVRECNRKDGYVVGVNRDLDLALSATLPKAKANALALSAVDHFTRYPAAHITDLYNLS